MVEIPFKGILREEVNIYSNIFQFLASKEKDYSQHIHYNIFLSPQAICGTEQTLTDQSCTRISFTSTFRFLFIKFQQQSQLIHAIQSSLVAQKAFCRYSKENEPPQHLWIHDCSAFSSRISKHAQHVIIQIKSKLFLLLTDEKNI